MRKSYDRPLIKLIFCPNIDVLTTSNVDDDIGVFNSNWITGTN